MKRIKHIYIRIETFLSNKPIATGILFSVLGLLASVIPLQSLLDSHLTGYFTIAWYYLYTGLVIQFFTATICFMYFKQKAFRNRMIKVIESILHKLNNPFSRSSETLLGKQIIEERYYDYIMMRCFDDYNKILQQLKVKYRDEFDDLAPLINNKRIHPGDWIPESELNGVKLSLTELKHRLA